MVRLIYIDLNPLELKYYLFIISLNKCNGGYKILFQKICIPKETEDIYIKC